MAARLTPLGMMAKWFVVPAVLAGLGYFVVGPRIGGDPALARKLRELRAGVIPDVKILTGPDVDRAEREEAAPGSSRGPDVEVSVNPREEKPPEPERPRRRRRREPRDDR